MHSSKDLERAFYRHTFQRYEMVAPNIYFGSNEMDIFALRRSGYVDEVEIKVSRSDFLADFNKATKWGRGLKHEDLKAGAKTCNYFSFLLPEDLVGKCEIPDYAGLYVFRLYEDGTHYVTEKKRAPILHKRKISDRQKYEVGRKMAYRYWH